MQGRLNAGPLAEQVVALSYPAMDVILLAALVFFALTPTWRTVAYRFGAAKGASSLVLLAIGTEIGGAIIAGDALVRGYSGFGGELGHVPISFNGPRCICGGRGCGMCCRPFHVPRDLVYPPAGDVPAIVQYPYYTCKGPDCFFKE